MTNIWIWAAFMGAALLEVGGDAIIRRGLYGGGHYFILIGALFLASYGLLVNSVRWDFSKLIGVYVAVFAWISMLVGRYYFKETIPVTTWAGLGIILVGALIIQWGTK